MCGRVRTSKLCMDKLCCMHVCMHVCMYGWMDRWMNGWMYGCIYIYGVKWLQMTQVRQSHPTQTCHSVRKSASDAAEVHAHGCLRPSATPATPTAAASRRSTPAPARHRSQPSAIRATPATQKWKSNSPSATAT